MTTAPEELRRIFDKTWQSPSGFWGWVATVNNRPLGTRYIIAALLFFTTGIVLALLMRTQLAIPDSHFLGPDTYNGIFTMHGSTMLYLFAVPLVEALGVYFIPLLIGSRDLAFPRLTNLGYWLYVFGGIILYSSVLFGAVPDAGWTAYPPLSGPQYSGPGMDFWLLGLTMLEIAGIGAALEIVITILKLRAPGMAIHHMPLIVWSFLVTGMMILFAFPTLLIATLLLEMDRTLGTHFFNPSMGGSTLLWQHLFWWFGHPEVYIIFLPATGIISSIIPVFTKRRLVAYPLVIAGIVSTGFVSFGLWTHHMFTTGIPELPMHFFTAASYMIALASGVQIFAWIATLWGRRIEYSVQMLFILSFFIIFVNGGITGVMVATMPFDWQVQDTYFVVAHFHHVLIGGAVLPLLAGLYHWLPKVSGRMFNVTWGKLSVGLIFVGFNLTFIPLYIAGLYGMRRRVYTFHEEMGVGTLNLIATIGAYILAAGFALALFNLLWSYLFGKKLTKDDPWGCGTLEWSVTSPPPNAGFNAPPVVRDRYPVWQQEAGEVPGDSYTVKLKRISDFFAFRPVGWRATLLTDITNARPQAVQFIPGPTLLPFFLSVAILVTTVAVLGKSYTTALVGALVSTVLTGWWMSKNPQLPKEEADQLTSQGNLPLESDGSRDLGWWGMIGTLVVLLMFLGTLIFSYFYIRLYSSQWPQDLLPLPDYGVPSIAAGLLLTGVFTQWLNRTMRKKESRSGLIMCTALNILIGTGFIILLSSDIHQSPFSMTFNAYSSLFYMIRIFLLLLFLTALSLQTGVFLRLLTKGEAPRRPQLRLWLQNAEMFWFVSIIYIFIGFFVIYGTPYF